MFLKQNICKYLIISSLALVVGCENKNEVIDQNSKTEPQKTEEIKSTSTEASQMDDNKVIATVNDSPIYQKDVNDFMDRDPQINAARKNNIPIPEEVKGKILDVLIEREVLLQAASKRNLLTDKELEDAQKSYLAMYGGEDNLKKVLANSGTSIDDFKANLKSDLLLKKYYEEEVAKKVNVSDEEISKEFKDNPSKYAEQPSVRARHILISVPQGSPEEKQKEALDAINAIYEEVNKPGVDFGAVAKARSDCPSKEKGGDLGFFTKEMMVPEFANQAFSMKPGEISKPVKTQFGHHIIKLEEVKAGGTPKLEDVKEDISQTIRMNKETEIGRPMLEKLKNEAKITKN